MHNSAEYIPEMLADGIRFLVYAGKPLAPENISIAYAADVDMFLEATRTSCVICELKRNFASYSLR